MNPHGWRRIGQPPVRKGVCRKQKTEIVRDKWEWDRESWKKRQAQQEGCKADSDN
jgi:hypothetical protein